MLVDSNGPGLVGEGSGAVPLQKKLNFLTSNIPEILQDVSTRDFMEISLIINVTFQYTFTVTKYMWYVLHLSV